MRRDKAAGKGPPPGPGKWPEPIPSRACRMLQSASGRRSRPYTLKCGSSSKLFRAPESSGAGSLAGPAPQASHHGERLDTRVRADTQERIEQARIEQTRIEQARVEQACIEQARIEQTRIEQTQAIDRHGGGLGTRVRAIEQTRSSVRAIEQARWSVRAIEQTRRSVRAQITAPAQTVDAALEKEPQNYGPGAPLAQGAVAPSRTRSRRLGIDMRRSGSHRVLMRRSGTQRIIRSGQWSRDAKLEEP